jgi:acetolactate synthase-1/2/3 large subunit
VLLVSGQINRDKIGKDVGMLHEVNDQMELVKHITKWQARALDAAEIPRTVHEAFLRLRSGRPRPVEIEIPPETLADVADVELYEPEGPQRQTADGKALERAVSLLAEARRPVIWAGGGVISSGGGAALQAVAELFQAPVITTSEGKGALSDRHELSLGVMRRTEDPMREHFQGADVVLAVGTRFADAPVLAGQQVVQIDVDDEELGRNHDKTLGILGDARGSLERLHAMALEAGVTPRPRRPEPEALRAERAALVDATQPQGGFIRAIRENIPEDGILVAGMTQLGYYSRWHYPVYQAGTYLTSSYFGNLGFAYPTALGAKVAQPDRAVVAISGDGGFLFNSQEMATAVMYGISVVVIVFNDNAYGNVMRDQINRFDGRVVGSRLHNPDFVKLAEAYGAVGVLARDAEELGPALRRALEGNRPTLIEVPVGMMPSPF